MPKQNIFSKRTLPTLAVMMLGLLPALSAAQTQMTRTSGAPLKGVDVKLGRYAGAQFAGSAPVITTKTDDQGHFSFPVLPRGQYVLTVSLPESAKSERGAAVRFCTITINLAGGKQTVRGYDIAQGKAFDPAVDPANSAALKAAKFVPLVFNSDGAQPCNGTIVKSKSNISNN